MQSDSKRATVIGILIVIVLVGVGGVMYARHRAAGGGTAASPDAAATASTTTTTIGGITVSGPGGVTIEPAPENTGTPAPNYRTPLTFKADISANVRQALEAQFADVQKILETKPFDFNAWIRLAQLRKMSGDYQGALTDLQYVSKIYPTSAVPLDNLGDLYLNFVVNYSKAESSYKQALKNNPNDVVAYESLFALYTDYGYKANTTAGVDILKQGIKVLPNETDFYVLLARYYKAKGEKADAKVQYDAAIKVAQQQGNTSLVAALQQEEAGL